MILYHAGEENNVKKRRRFERKKVLEVVSKEQMPQKVWKECINCIKFPNCDEIAVSRIL